MTSAQGATRVGEHVVGRYSVSDGQRPILLLAASCDSVRHDEMYGNYSCLTAVNDYERLRFADSGSAKHPRLVMFNTGHLG